MTRNHLLKTPALLLLLLLGAVLAASCSRLGENHLTKLPLDDVEGKAAVKGDFQVKVDGASLTFHAPQVAASKANAFLPRIEKLLADRDTCGARELVVRYPELAIDDLRSGVAGKSNGKAITFVAAEYDRWLQVPARQGWSLVYPETGAKESASDGNASSVVAYATARRKLLHEIEGGKPGVSVIDGFAPQTQNAKIGVLRLDACRTAAIGYLVALQPQRAADLLETGCQLAAKIDRYQECQLRLLQSDALRRAGKIELANRAWAESVVRAADLAKLRTPCVDPALWDTASYLRPVNEEWPEEVAVAIAPRSPIPPSQDGGESADREALVWGAIGQALLERGDHEAALVSLKRAETMTASKDRQDWLRLAEANTLARVGQVPAATAVLAGPLSSTDRQLAAAAAAALGSIRCQAGDASGGFRLLKKGIESGSLEDWIGIADAEADYGLACLMHGDEKSGLKWLHSAESRFESLGEPMRLRQSLANEREYWKVRKQQPKVAEIESRIVALKR